MGKTISFVKGKGSLTHNNRDFIAKNVDEERISWNIYYKQQPLKEAYQQLFGTAIEDYNTKQKRKDRLIKDYLTDIKNSGNGEKPFYEMVVQVGKMTDTGVLDKNGNLSEVAKEARDILDYYIREFQERNPNLYVFNAVLHMDEATPHLHIDYIPVAHGYKNKMHTRNSLSRALQEMGFEDAVSRLDNETTHWQERERLHISELCQERGIEIEVLGIKRDNYTVPEYKAAMMATDELKAELEILNAEKQEAEAVIEAAHSEIEGISERVEESRQQLVEIEKQIADREKRCRIYEKKIDKYLAAEKPVMKELAEIESKTKPLPNVLGGEPAVRISQKDLEHLMSMAKVSGTLSRLNEAYENELYKLEVKIEKFTKQLKTVKEKIGQLEDFIDIKGLKEEFQKFLKPKSAIKKLHANKEQVAEYKPKQKEEEKKKQIEI